MTASEKEGSRHILATISTPSTVVTSSSDFHPYTHPYASVISPLHLSSPQSSTKFTHNLLHQVIDDKAAIHGESFLPKTSKQQHRFHPSITLKNSGSVARDHLASERTFLAYIRTSLALSSAGVGRSKRVVSRLALIFIVFKALVQLLGLSQTSSRIANERVFLIHKITHPLGAALVLLGIIVLVFGLSRTFSDRTCLNCITFRNGALLYYPDGSLKRNVPRHSFCNCCCRFCSGYYSHRNIWNFIGHPIASDIEV